MTTTTTMMIKKMNFRYTCAAKRARIRTRSAALFGRKQTSRFGIKNAWTTFWVGTTRGKTWTRRGVGARMLARRGVFFDGTNEVGGRTDDAVFSVRGVRESVEGELMIVYRLLDN